MAPPKKKRQRPRYEYDRGVPLDEEDMDLTMATGGMPIPGRGGIVRGPVLSEQEKAEIRARLNAGGGAGPRTGGPTVPGMSSPMPPPGVPMTSGMRPPPGVPITTQLQEPPPTDDAPIRNIDGISARDFEAQAAEEDNLTALMEYTGAPDDPARRAAGEISPNAPPNMEWWKQQEQAAGPPPGVPVTSPMESPAQGNARPQMNWEDELLNAPTSGGSPWRAAALGAISAAQGGDFGDTYSRVEGQRQQALAQQQQTAIARARTIQQGQALPLQQAREDRYWKALENSMNREQNVQHRFETQEERRQRELGLKEDRFETQKDQYGRSYDQRERFQDRTDARQQRQIEYGERGPQRHAEGIRLDPVKRDAARTEYAAIAMPLKDAIGAYQYLEKSNPQLLERFAQVGTSGKLGMLTQLEVSPGERGAAEQAALAQLNKLLVKEGFGTGGKQFTETERGLIGQFTGVPMGPGFNPFQSPKVLKDFMRGLNEVRRMRKQSIESSFGADIWER